VGRQLKPGEVVALDGAAATEAAFKKLAPGRRVLHLATHGVILGESCDPDRIRVNPLLLSGLALAGANRSAEAPPGSEDGILTAEEIASLDLSSVEWAVLSGCETGLGRVTTGEGVLGLRRAFEIAGARTLIMSLWRVEDASTLDWMRGLYESRSKGLSTAEAVREASVRMIQAARSRGRSTHPYYWGGFVAAGDWK
jgi:CHAT domain-containing protein